MKKLAILVLATAVTVPAMSQSFADRLMGQFGVGYDEAVILGGLARDFGLTDRNIFDIRSQYGYRNDDLISALYLNRYGKASWTDIDRMRRSGMGWGEIAHAIGMHPGQFNKMRKDRWNSDRDMYDDLWRDRMSRRGSRSDDLDWARNQGFSYRDAYIADQIARANNSRFPTVLNRYRQKRSWSSDILRGGNGSPRTIKDEIGRSGTKANNPPKRGNSGNNKANENRGRGKGKGNNGKGKGRGNGGFLNGR
jgi:hypothetical protein